MNRRQTQSPPISGQRRLRSVLTAVLIGTILITLVCAVFATVMAIGAAIPVTTGMSRVTTD